ncbi:clathrin light chain A-like isoform X4 [Amblyraja radiata]|uniref:clathrin light chain A-like isoform X4 n=1 Tax=Amblyraja radiata TaxID=386614 RepID=UPI001402D79D|nr:clathrin light chain A-like isoform X4 [Amblyraja radiata]
MEDATGTSPLHHSPPEAELVPEPLPPAGPEEDGEVDTVNGDSSQGSVADLYAAISEVDGLCQEPDSIRTWREEQVKHLEALDENSREAELEWREKAKRELEDWYTQQEEQLEGMKTNNRADDVAEDVGPDLCSGSDWERVLHLCDLNSKSSKPTKDVSRMRSVLLSLSQVPVPLK